MTSLTHHLIETIGSPAYPLGDDMMRAWVSDPSKSLWTQEDLLQDPNLSWMKPQHNKRGETYYGDKDGFIKLVNGKWHGFDGGVANPDDDDETLASHWYR